MNLVDPNQQLTKIVKTVKCRRPRPQVKVRSPINSFVVIVSMTGAVGSVLSLVLRGKKMARKCVYIDRRMYTHTHYNSSEL